MRRKVTTVANITILFTSAEPDQVIARFGLCPEVLELTVVEEDQVVGKTTSGAACMLRHVSSDNYTMELLCTTGSDAFVKEVTTVAKDRGKRLSSTIVGKGKHAQSEPEIFAALGLEYVPPELREGRIAKGGPPIDTKDLHGDLHVRSSSLDGGLRIAAMTRAAKEMGHQYICFCDRVGGRRMDADAFDQRNGLIDDVQKTTDIVLLKGAEVDITPDGRLDAPPDILEKLDLVIGSVNTKLTMPPQEMEARILRAMDDPLMDVFGHPTNRVIGLRDKSQIDLERIAERAAERKIALEINSYPDHLDLSDDEAYKIYEAGAYYSLGTDASFPNELDYWSWAVTIARKSLLDRPRILNAMNADKLKARAWRK
jgi:DNA polymerase (family 10)